MFGMFLATQSGDFIVTDSGDELEVGL
jgi:hypothetical protein